MSIVLSLDKLLGHLMRRDSLTKNVYENGQEAIREGVEQWCSERRWYRTQEGISVPRGGVSLKGTLGTLDAGVQLLTNQ